MVALLYWNLFTYGDLWIWLNDPFDTAPLTLFPVQIAFPSRFLDSMHDSNSTTSTAKEQNLSQKANEWGTTKASLDTFWTAVANGSVFLSTHQGPDRLSVPAAEAVHPSLVEPGE